MSEETHSDEARFQAGIVVDTHVHTLSYLPAFASSLFRWAIRGTVPPPFFLSQLPASGVDVVVANAVGDGVATAWWGRPPWRAIQAQLARIRSEAEGRPLVISALVLGPWPDFSR